MGKKSSRRFRSKSLGSLSFMSNIKNNRKVKKKKSNRMEKNIKKLFQQLRYSSDSSNSFRSAENTIIEIGEETIKPESLQRKCSNNLLVASNLVVIDDDDLVINDEPCPLQCSTPISNIKQPLKQNISPLTVNNSNVVNKLHQEVEDLTKEISNESYLTIDLTNETCFNKTNQSQYNTVIDLANTTDDHNNALSNNSDQISLSEDSDVTVINMKKHQNKLNKAQMKKFAYGIANLDSSERGKLLQFIAQKIFKGSNGPDSTNISLHSLKKGVSRATETVEDTYIKEVILGQGCSSNSIGSNIYNPERDIKYKTGLRMIIIDGSNVAMEHSKGRVFSVKGLKICIDYFLRRGHVVKAFVPHFRCKYGKSTDGRLLDQLERQGLVIYTPSREIQGRMVTSYDDRYIVQCAAEFDGVIVSGDNYRDLLQENPRWRHVIENRLLQFTWVGDMIMFPRDPLGRRGPTLEQFLRYPDPPQ